MVPEIMIGNTVADFVEGVFQRVERRLGVQRVEDRLDQQNVGAAIDQAKRRLAIGGAQIVEARRRESRSWRRRARSTPCDWSVRSTPRRNASRRLLFNLDRKPLARQPRALEVELVSQLSSP